ncbi:hypothetical protein ABZ639_02135 [Saccharomonospora sp. NPDC006951]
MIWTWRLLAPLISLLIIVLAVREAPSAFAASFGSGIRGEFTATRVVSAARGSSMYYGDFVPSDGSPERRDIALVPGGGVDGVGETIDAVDTGNPRGVYPASGSVDWVWISLLGGAAAVVLIAWFVSVVSAVRARVTRA